MSAYIVPAVFIGVLLTSLFKKQDAYGAFIDGSGSAIKLMTGVFPYLLTVMTAVEVFRQSGVSGVVADFLSPAMRIFGIPKELTELILLRPLSGAGALSVLQNVFTTYGADTYIGRCASVVYGSSETVFYLSTIYFSQSDVKKLGPAVPIALTATFLGSVAGCALCRVL
ncbi:MAG: hypothetical protein LBP26_01975 [Clostridiales bacterium]|jgi:spore maturation protein B|nr:hypothetical protein [Clostridiales bacterium]